MATKKENNEGWPLGPAGSQSERLAGAARLLALQLAAEIRCEWAYAADVLNRGVRTHKNIGAKVRRQLSHTVYSLVRFDRRLNAICDEIPKGQRGPVRDLSDVTRDEAKLLILELASGVNADLILPELRRVFGFAVPASAIVRPDAGLRRRKGIEREATRLSFPDWMVEKLGQDHGGAKAAGILDALNGRAPLTVLANRLRVTRDELAERLRGEGMESEPCEWAENGLRLLNRVNVYGLDAYSEGLMDVMDEGSQLVAQMVDAQPGMRVVDACAGAGGKTLALGQGMQGAGSLLAIDVSGKKLEELRRRARQAGLSNVRACEALNDGTTLPAEAKEAAWDRVLVDAPCSSVGSMRRAPEARWRLQPADVRNFAMQQLAILVNYSHLVAPGGRLVYATCTLFEDENHNVIERFLGERSEFERLPLARVLGEDKAQAVGDGLSLRLFPHIHGCDGFFASVLQRKS